MDRLLDGLGTMFAFIGFGIAIDFIFNSGDAIKGIIRAFKGECDEED